MTNKLFLSAGLVLVALIGYAQIPATLSYQGLMTDNSGIIVADGSHTVLFKFYTVLSGGSPIVTRGPLTVATFKGLFTTVIGNNVGSNNAALPYNIGSTQYYIGIEVDGGTELLPRVTLTAVPYAFQAQTVDATGITGTLPGSQVGTGISAANITTGTLSGALVGSGVNATNITTGTLSGALVGSGVAATNITGTLPGSQVGTNISAANITTGTLPSAQIGAGTVDNTKLASGIDAAKITTGTLPTAQIGAGTIDNTKLASGIDATKITVGTLPAAQIAAGAIDNTKLAASGLDAAKITAGTLPAAQIGAGTIDNTKLASGIDATKITAGTLNVARLPNTTNAILDLGSGTNSLNLPRGNNTTDRPTPVAGMLRYNNTDNVLEYYNGTSWFYTVPKIAFLKEIQPSGGNAGTISATSSFPGTTRVLNTVQGDNSIVLLNTTSYIFTLGAGEYIIEALAPAYFSLVHKIRLYDPVNSIEYGMGTSEYQGNSGTPSTLSFLFAKITISSSTSFVIQHAASMGSTIPGAGVPSSFAGANEVYTQVKITKLRGQ